MSTCIVCTSEALRGLVMHDKELLASVARDVIQGMVSARTDLKGLKPPRQGICIVERCARTVEAPCGSCQTADCLRCAIAAELRAAEDRINADRDDELAELGIGNEILEGIIDKMVESVCAKHAPFGAALSGQWYRRRSFLEAAATADTVHEP